ncbi:hypothetical protein PsorP6_010947 [Peronosclerospora sorghi]|uniref:Uncharacterized protein n=1 Tax=Peronosclerospora sorghi TaxID=230839 RepID=A0ACC0VWA2_9STRA|nr:hypothetical protein PsorP6_010947 [Peronosclerospora sorghi]
MIEYYTGKTNDDTRIFYIKLSTDRGHSIEGGTKTDDLFIDGAPAGYQLCGLQSFSDSELDMTSAIWTSIDPIHALPTTSGGN